MVWWSFPYGAHFYNQKKQKVNFKYEKFVGKQSQFKSIVLHFVWKSMHNALLCFSYKYPLCLKWTSQIIQIGYSPLDFAKYCCRGNGSRVLFLSYKTPPRSFYDGTNITQVSFPGIAPMWNSKKLLSGFSDHYFYPHYQYNIYFFSRHCITYMYINFSAMRYRKRHFQRLKVEGSAYRG